MMDRLLTLGVVCLILLAGARVMTVRPPVRGMPGADVSSIRGVDEVGQSLLLADEERTIVFVFDSGCVHCSRVAARWREWFGMNRSVNTIAVSAELWSDAASFAWRYGWRVTILRVHPHWNEPEARAFMARAPWIHVVSPEGVIEASFFGGDLDLLDEFLDDGHMTSSPDVVEVSHG